jgi:hypothetical protein
VMSPAKTSLRNSRLNSTPGKLAVIRQRRRVGRCRDRLDPGSDLEARARNVAIALARSANAKLS